MKIRAYTSFEESNKIHRWRDFEIVGKLPVLGEIKEISPEYDGEKTTLVNIFECPIDCEQGNDEVFEYEYFKLEYKFEKLNEDDEWEFEEYQYEFVAVKKQ